MQQTDNNYWDGAIWRTNEYWLTAAGTEAWSYDANDIDIPWVTDTQYIIRSRAADNAGNVEIPDIGNIFMYDNEPPEGSILINNDDRYTNSTTVILSLNSNDSGSGVSQMAFSTDDNEWSAWEIFSTTKTFELSAGDGEKFVYFKVKDHTDNIAEPVFDSIILDTVPPHSLSILLNNGATETNSTKVTIDITALDDISGVYRMSFSTNKKDWSGWENYTNTKPFTLASGVGVKTVYFRAIDMAGNIAEPVSDSILLNIPLPPEENPDQEPESEKQLSNMLFWIILIIIIILLILLTIIIKRKILTARKLSTEEADTIKPVISPAHETEKKYSVSPELKRSLGTTIIDKEQHTPNQVIPAITIPPSTGKPPPRQKIAQAAQLPKLPPK